MNKDKKDLDKLKFAAQKFVDKLNECQPYIDNAFVMEFVHGREHQGPTYGKELENLKKILKEL